MQDGPVSDAASLFGMPAERGRWVFVALSLVLNLLIGSVYAWSVFVGPLTDYFSGALGVAVTPNDILLPFSIILAVFAVTMLFTGGLVDRFGPRNVTVLGGVMTGLGYLLASLSSSIPMISITYGVVGGVGVGLAYGVLIALPARWFPDRRGLAVGLTVLGVGLSGLFAAAIAGALLGAHGVMDTFRIFGAGIIVLTSLLALPLEFPPPGWAPAGWRPADPGRDGPQPRDFDRSEMLRSRSFYGLWISYFLASLAGLVAVSTAAPVGADVGVPAGLATLLVGFFSIFNAGGRPAFGALTDRLEPRTTAMVSFTLIALASLIMWQVPSAPSYILAFAVLWGCLGGWLAIAPTVTGAYFGTRDYPRCYGAVFLAYGAGAIAGPQLAGFIKASTGSYIGVFPYVLALAVVGGVIAFALLRPPTPVS